MPFSLVPFVLLAIPLLEIAAFVVIGGKIGVFATLAMVFVTAFIGSVLLRIQGFGLIERIRREMDAGRLPERELVHGVMLLIAALLLITPGFITDTLGFLLFVPAFRDIGWRLIRKRFAVTVTSGGFGTGHSGTPRRERPGDRVIDLDAEDFSREPDRDSPWSRDQDDNRRRR